MIRPVRRIGRFSRIPVRLMAFNLLLLFIPLAGVFFLGSYEESLESAQTRDMLEQARVVAAAVTQLAGDPGRRDAFFETIAGSDPLARRFRLLDSDGRVIVDTRPEAHHEELSTRAPVRRGIAYRAAARIVRPVLRLIRPPEPNPEPSDAYERSTVLSGDEIESALAGRAATLKRSAPGGHRSVIIYAAVPVEGEDGSAGAVLVSQSTYAILTELYSTRVGLFRISLASLAAAVVLTLFFAATIVAPLRSLRRDARALIDRRSAPRGRFSTSRRRDEIGELSRALERLSRRVDEQIRFLEGFAADVSHELKNPLAAIRNAVEIASDVDSPAERARFLNVAQQEIARMEKLLVSMRQLTTLDAEISARATAEPVNFGAIATAVAETARLRTGRTVPVTAADDAVAHGSPEHFTQMVENLVDNALSFTPHDGEVSIDVSRTSRDVVLRVVDEGTGIPEEHLDRIFDRFFTWRPESSRRTSSHSGLGLAIVKRIAEGYGGRVTAANRAEGGAVFEVRLPA